MKKFILKPMAVSISLLCSSIAYVHAFPTSTVDAETTEAIVESVTASPIKEVDRGRIRTYDGSYNNQQNINIGMASVNLRRLPGMEALYKDGISELVDDRPNPKFISNVIFEQPGSTDIFDPTGLSDFHWAWGQFLDHDLDHTSVTSKENSENFINISFPGDPFGISLIKLTRSLVVTGTGFGTENTSQHSNNLSAWIDASMVYGSSAERATKVRSFEGGKLLINGRYDDNERAHLPQEGKELNDPFFAGDLRVGEHAALSSLHTLFLREHNRHAEIYLTAHTELDPNSLDGDEQIFQHCRKIVGAIIQRITYQEYLPGLLGRQSIPVYSSYRSVAEADISSTFSTAAFRFGHSAVGHTLLRVNAAGEEIEAGHLPVLKAFMKPSRLTDSEQGGLDPLLRGMAKQRQQRVDAQLVVDLRNFLFGDMDLAAINIQRGRDHGLVTYNQARVAVGLSKVISFAQITSDTEVQQRLSDATDGNVDALDLWVGGLAEHHVADAIVGPLFHKILVDQFTALRDGDRFYYQNRDFLINPGALSDDELAMVDASSLKAVIMRNTGISGAQELPDNVFYVADLQPVQSASLTASLNKLREHDARSEFLAKKTNTKEEKIIERQQQLLDNTESGFEVNLIRRNGIRDALLREIDTARSDH